MALIHSWVTQASAGWRVSPSQAQMSVIYDDAYVSKTGLGRRRSIGCRNQVSGLGFLLQKQARFHQHKQCNTTAGKLWWIFSSRDKCAFLIYIVLVFLRTPALSTGAVVRNFHLPFYLHPAVLQLSLSASPKRLWEPTMSIFEREIFLNHHGNILIMLNQLQGNDDMADLI